jgi:hypothetical protein
MSKTSGSYELSRYNAMKFGIQHDGPIPCMGSERCRHRHCSGAYTPPSAGIPCPWEAEYAKRLEDEFRDRYEMLTITPDVDDFEELVVEFVNIYLQRSRAMTRMNRGWERRGDDDRLSAAAYSEFEIADLYLDRLARREERLNQVLGEGVQRMRDRAERLRPHLHAMEALIAGRNAAAREAAEPLPASQWDEFVDGAA